jgi:hypothetical protein
VRTAGPKTLEKRFEEKIKKIVGISVDLNRKTNTLTNCLKLLT